MARTSQGARLVLSQVSGGIHLYEVRRRACGFDRGHLPRPPDDTQRPVSV